VVLQGIGKAYAANAGYAIACGIHYGISLDTIAHALNAFPIYENRGSIHSFKKAIVYNHTYNIVGSAVLRGLEDFNTIKSDNKLIIIGPCLRGIRDPQDLLYKSILDAACAITSPVIVYGQQEYLKCTYPQGIITCTTTKELIQHIKGHVSNHMLYIYIHTSSMLNTEGKPLFKLIESSLKTVLN
jgi:UDP-N-acetylmuramyl pentapeptide synthase